MASGYCPGYGFESTNKFNYFVIGVTEVSKENLEKVNATIFETLEEICKNGFDKNLTDAALHQIELNSRIIGGNFGLNLFMSLISAVNHELPELIDRNLEIGKNLEEIREKIDAGGYFEGIVKKYFLDNPKRVTLTTNPDSGLLDSKDYEEVKRLKEIQKTLTETDQAKIIADSVMLQKHQEQVQDLSILPTLRVSDIEPREAEIHSQKFEVNGVPVTYFTHCPDGVTFIQLKFSTKQIDESLTNFLFMFERFLPQMGTKTFKYDEFAELVFLNTGKFDVSVRAQSDPLDVNNDNGYVMITMACLDRNIETMFNLITEITTEPDFAHYEQMSRMVRLESSELASNFNNHGLCVSHAQASLSKPLAEYEALSNTRFMCKFGANFLKVGSRIGQLCEAMQEQLVWTLKKLIMKDGMEIACHSNQKNQDY